MKRNYLLITVLSAFTVFIFSCTKEPLNHLSSEESRIYVVNADSSVNFSSFKTYSISDSAEVYDNGQTYKDFKPIDSFYITAIKKYMSQSGYTLVDKNAKPDIGINLNRIYNTSTGYIGYDDYWDYYGGYWDPYYWGYSGYGYYVPSSYGIYQITQGAMSIDMLDLKDAATKQKIDVIWNGLIRGEGIFDDANADASVKALFDQSTYLKTN